MRTPSVVLFLTVAATLAAQQPDFKWDKALAAGMRVTVHNLSGNVAVTPSTSGKVEITGTKRGSRRADDVTVEVYESDRGITVCPKFRNMDTECDDNGFHTHSGRDYGDRDDVSIDIEVKLPKGMPVSAMSVSGDVRVAGAEGTVRANSVSGNVRMEGLRATSVRASSVSGDVMVVVEALSGDGALSFSSVSGDVTAELPKNLDADVSLRSVSGSLDSDFPLTLSGRMSRGRLEARIGKGGRDLEVHTVSGDVHLRTARP